jgi:hypothetical protein
MDGFNPTILPSCHVKHHDATMDTPRLHNETSRSSSEISGRKGWNTVDTQAYFYGILQREARPR